MTITDADRKAAAETYQRFRDYDFAGWILEGKCDTDSTVQAFARHHQAAEAEGYAKGQADTVARVVAWLRDEKYSWVRLSENNKGTAMSACADTAALAIQQSADAFTQGAWK